jgi:hypothetical protein
MEVRGIAVTIRRIRILVRCAVLCVGLAATTVGASAADPWIGVWTLNRAKSASSHPDEIPLNSTLIFRDNPGQQVLSVGVTLPG